MSSDNLRVAVIGCGRIGTDLTVDRSDMPPGWLPVSHAAAVQATPGLVLAGFADSDKARLEEAARRFEVTACYTDAATMLSDLRPDIVTIATRTPGRCELVKLASESGVRGIHVEKPFASSLADCRNALAVIRNYGIHLSFGATRRFMDAYRKAKAIVDDGEIGRLHHIQIEHGRDMLMWGHPHSIDLMLMFAGGARCISVQGTCTLETEIEDRLTVDADPYVENAVLRFESGLLGTITCAGGLNTRLSGEDGVLSVLADGTALELRRRSNPNSAYFQDVALTECDPATSGTVNALRALRAAIVEEAASPIDPADIEEGQKLLLSIARSAMESGAAFDPAMLEEAFTVNGRFGELYA